MDQALFVKAAIYACAANGSFAPRSSLLGAIELEGIDFPKADISHQSCLCSVIASEIVVPNIGSVLESKNIIQKVVRRRGFLP